MDCSQYCRQKLRYGEIDRKGYSDNPIDTEIGQ